MSNVLSTTVRVGLVMLCVDYGVHEIASQILDIRKGVIIWGFLGMMACESF